ncbi:hypothetical protein A5761_13365 [Mycolicibacterium setense]|uniref:hypothetical protein n=1 Tax=Mycolicibacterium setense TaxID=431269 RepID=UPI0007EB15DA|nr:hypothetical protein [Mycolicibacterium setense]OBB15974.1 hypothetical protein A5761_13365 [Mycolicibacterium setense]
MTGQPVAGSDARSASAQVWREKVLPSDCLLSGEQMSVLSGVEIDDGRDTDIKNPDGTIGRSCKYYAAAGGVLSFTASIKVMSPSSGVITEQLLADIGKQGATEVPGIGRRMVIEPLTPPSNFPVMRLATDRYLANVVLVAGNIPGPPDIAAWTRAASQILESLPA